MPPPLPGTAARVGGWVGRLRSEGLVRWILLPGWAQALAVYLLSRLVDFVIIDRTARFQPASLWNGPDPGYFDIVSLWDGDWYRRIAENGYPQGIPRDQNGLARQNEWGFYPLFPLLTRGVMSVTGFGWPVAASIVTLSCAALATLLLRSLLAPLVGPELALWSVALFCFFPAAPVFQLAYTEGVAALLLVAALWCLQRRLYWLAVPVVLLLGFTRPLAAPFAAVVGVHALLRLYLRDQPLLGAARWAGLVTLTGACALAAVEWPLVAAGVTGEPSAYVDTMASWRTSHQVTAFRPWLDISRYFFGHWFGPVALAVIVVGLLSWVLRARSVPIGADLRTWCVAYLGYLLAVLDPITSLFRYLVMLFPLGVLLAGASSSRAYRCALVVAFAAGQVVWVVWLWRFIPPTDWPP